MCNRHTYESFTNTLRENIKLHQHYRTPWNDVNLRTFKLYKYYQDHS